LIHTKLYPNQLRLVPGKLYVGRELDHFELSQGDRGYRFLIHEPLGVTLQYFLDISRGIFPIYCAKELILPDAACFGTYQVIHASPTLP
jgi:hypothetical protein